MKIYSPTLRPEQTKDELLHGQLKAAAKGLIFALKEARSSRTSEDRMYWVTKAKRFKAYLERLGKNK